MIWLDIVQTGSSSDPADVDGVEPFFSFPDFEFDGVAIANLVNAAADVDKKVFPRIGVFHETETFGFIEKLDRAFIHC